jgi:hypothetical protein
MKVCAWIALLFFGLLWQNFVVYSPIVWLTTSEHNFGEIPQYQEQNHRFYFRNNSQDSMSIDNVRTTCGCTASQWQETSIPPDSTGFVSITYDAKQVGAFKKKIKVFFANQRLPEVLFVEGFVKQGQ